MLQCPKIKCLVLSSYPHSDPHVGTFQAKWIDGNSSAESQPGYLRKYKELS